VIQQDLGGLSAAGEIERLAIEANAVGVRSAISQRCRPTIDGDATGTNPFFYAAT
jgi:hypothetical protein